MDDPARYLVVAERFSELVTWLKCNDVDPSDVPFKTDVFIEMDTHGVWMIRHAVYTRSASGVVQYDPVTLEYEYGSRFVPLQNDPPMWWLKEVTASSLEGSGHGLPGFNED